MKKAIIFAIVAFMLNCINCQSPSSIGNPDQSSEGISLTIDAVISASFRIYRYNVSYNIDTLKIPRSSISHIAIRSEYDTVLIEKSDIVYGMKKTAIGINPECARTVNAIADFYTDSGKTLHGYASMTFNNTNGATYPMDTRKLKINLLRYFSIKDLFDKYVFHLYSTDSGSTYSVTVNQLDGMVAPPSYASNWTSVTGIFKFPHSGNSKQFLVTFFSNGTRNESFACTKERNASYTPNSYLDTSSCDTFTFRASDAMSSSVGTAQFGALFDRMKNLDSITCMSTDSVNPFKKTYTAEKFWQSTQIQIGSSFVSDACNSTFIIADSYFYCQLLLEKLSTNLSYTLDIEYLDGRPMVSIFKNAPFDQLVQWGSQW